MCDGTFSHHCSKKSISTMCGIPQCGSFSKKSKSTTSFYVVFVTHGVGERELIALNNNDATQFFGTTVMNSEHFIRHQTLQIRVKLRDE